MSLHGCIVIFLTQKTKVHSSAFSTDLFRKEISERISARLARLILKSEENFLMKHIFK